MWLLYLSHGVRGGAADGDPGAADALRVERDRHHVRRQRPVSAGQLIVEGLVQFRPKKIEVRTETRKKQIR